MKNILVSLCLAVFLLCGTMATAQNAFTNSSEKAYFTLKNLFEQSKDPIVETDIDLASNLKSNQKCAI